LPELRAAAQLLHRPAGYGHPADVARAICGAQAQDLRAGRLAFRARSARLRAADVDRARTEERSLVRTWAMRGTMHLLASDDAAWLVPLFEPALAAFSQRRLGRLGVDSRTQERALREIGRALEDGPLLRSELVERLERKGIAIDAARRVHVFRLATARGISCLGPDAGGQTCLALERDWLGPRSAHDRESALAELALRYSRAFGPATEADFAGWAGLGLREIRSALERAAPGLTRVRLRDEDAWMTKGAARRPRAGAVRLLPAWDTYLLGHRDRRFLAGPRQWRRIMPGGGMLRPTIVRDGAALGVWGSRRSGARIQVELEPFAELDGSTRAAIEAEVADLGRFEGMPAALV
jgi:winged helix DNA-binding protein